MRQLARRMRSRRGMIGLLGAMLLTIFCYIIAVTLITLAVGSDRAAVDVQNRSHVTDTLHGGLEAAVRSMETAYVTATPDSWKAVNAEAPHAELVGSSCYLYWFGPVYVAPAAANAPAAVDPNRALIQVVSLSPVADLTQCTPEASRAPRRNTAKLTATVDLSSINGSPGLPHVASITYSNGLLGKSFVASPDQLSTSPVAAWLFDDDAGTIATAAVGGLNGTHSGGVLVNQEGVRTLADKGAVSYDGVDDYTFIPDNNLLEPSTAVTVSAWINPTAYSAADAAIAAKIGTYQLMLTTTGGVQFAVVGAGTPYTATSGAVVPVGRWTHVSGTYSSTTGVLRVYINGEIVAQSTGSGTVSGSSTSLRVGRLANAGSYFAGRIDELQLYSSALTPTQIAELIAAR